jgi:hypothetical protein
MCKHLKARLVLSALVSKYVTYVKVHICSNAFQKINPTNFLFLSFKFRLHAYTYIFLRKYISDPAVHLFNVQCILHSELRESNFYLSIIRKNLYR